jgi:hypothetical protein
MKKQCLSLLVILGIIASFLSGCTKEQDKLTDTTFTLTATEQKDFTLTGYFTASGDPTTAGTFVMDITPGANDSIHCSQSLVIPTVGTITIRSDCSMMTNTGSWYITEGTGAYANLHGSGSLVMSIPQAGNIIEALYGKTWRK